MAIPPNGRTARQDNAARVCQDEDGKWKVVVEDIATVQETHQPVLVGTTSVEDSEYLSERLKKRGVPHKVLNAKNHEHEATIVAQAGRRATASKS